MLMEAAAAGGYEEKFMRIAFEEVNQRLSCTADKLLLIYYLVAKARKALEHDEVPVGCVFVLQGKTGTQTVIGRGSNETNETKNVCMPSFEVFDQF